ncbi:hypothetical protein CATMIT_01739, partial [Catenibacterium mitsuokai DSM 15897]
KLCVIELWRRSAARRATASNQHSAGSLDPLRIDPARRIRQQRRDQRPDVLGFAGAAERRMRGDHRVDLRIVADHAAAEVGLDRAGRERVGDDAALAEFAGEITGEHFDAALHHRVGRTARQRETGQPAGQVEDAAAVGEHGQQRLGQEIRRLQMHRDQMVELRRGGLGDGGVQRGAGVVDQR